MSEFDHSKAFSAPPPVAVPTQGLSDNAAAALAYVTILPAILFLILEPYNRKPFIRFHAFQCIGLSIVAFASSIIMIVPIIGWLIGILMLPVLFIAWLVCIIQAYNGKLFKLPFLGSFVENMAQDSAHPHAQS